MKTPRKLKSDVSTNLPYKFLEKKKQNKNKFESEYLTKPQTAVAGTKHTITTDTNKIRRWKFLGEPLPNSFQNSLSRWGKNKRGMNGRFIQMSLPSLDTEGDEEEESQPEDDKREKTPARET